MKNAKNQSTLGYANRACLAFAVFTCTVIALVEGLGCLSADAASTLFVDADPAAAAQAAATSLTAPDGERDAGSEGTSAGSADAADPGSEVATLSLDEKTPYPITCHVLVDGQWKVVDKTGAAFDSPDAEGFQEVATGWVDSSWAGKQSRRLTPRETLRWTRSTPALTWTSRRLSPQARGARQPMSSPPSSTRRAFPMTSAAPFRTMASPPSATSRQASIWCAAAASPTARRRARASRRARAQAPQVAG